MAAKPREVSSSDGESDSESELVQVKRKRKRQHSKYQCPADFVFSDLRPCASTRLESVNDGNTELWLIKAPQTFNPDSLSGIRLPTLGLEAIQPSTRQQQAYSVLSRPVATGNARLLTTAGQRPGDTFCADAFSGIISISESYGDCQGNQAPVAIPTRPAPIIPEGLRQRFQPFGSRTPSGAREHRQDGSADGPTAAGRLETDQEESGAPKQKKKKKKKDKRIKVEKEEMVEEEVSLAPRGLTEASRDAPREEPSPGEEAVEEKKKKKKKKKSKDRDRDAVEESGGGAETGSGLKEEVVVKTEPLDIAYGNVENVVKKKKVKKEKRREQD